MLEPKWIISEYAVIRTQSASANQFSNFLDPDFWPEIVSGLPVAPP